MVDIKDRLQEALDLRDMRPIDLCKKTGIPKNTLSYYLKGKTQPKADRIHQIGLALGVSEAWLLGYDVPRDRVDEPSTDEVYIVVSQMRDDPDFVQIVSVLAELPAEDYASIKHMVRALAGK